jgi:hypothetical protein
MEPVQNLERLVDGIEFEKKDKFCQNQMATSVKMAPCQSNPHPFEPKASGLNILCLHSKRY